jgi:hypothetical protein
MCNANGQYILIKYTKIKKNKKRTKIIYRYYAMNIERYGHFCMRSPVVRIITYGIMKKELHFECSMFLDFLIKYKYKLPHNKHMA